MSRRTQAAIAVGLLAFSAVGAPAAVAAGPDEEVEGSVEVVESTDPGPADLGEGALPLTDAGQAAPEEEVEDVVPTDSAGDVPLIEEATTDEAAGPAGEPVVEAEEEPAAPTVGAEPVANAEPAVPPAETPASTEPEPGNDGPSVDASAGAKRLGRSGEQRRAAEPTAPREAAAPAPAAPPASAPAPATAEAAAPAVRVVAGTSTTASTSRASAGGRFHVVRRGESLWAIAADVLGERATVPRIAREVNRLWALNEDRIASGDPDLLYAGTRLRLG